MQAASTANASRFVRRTQLGAHEYRTNFRQLDCDIIAALVSEEASRVTSQMSKIYLSLINSPVELWERDGVLRFMGCEREGKWQTAWGQLVEAVGVASATAHKAFQWMSREGIIGYYAGRNGVGIRIFINRAASSIARKAATSQKNLRLVQASSAAPHTSANEAPFKDSFADLETSETDFNPRAPENGATEPKVDVETLEPNPTTTNAPRSHSVPHSLQRPGAEQFSGRGISTAVVERLTREIVPHLRAAAAHEHERTREWFITHALPKAIRVSQRSAYDVLRAYGLVKESRPPKGAHSTDAASERERYAVVDQPPQPLPDNELNTLAESCVALLAAQGQAIERTLSEMSVETGGFLLAEDAPKVRAKAEALLLDVK